MLVVKIGGGSEIGFDSFIADIKSILEAGEQVVVVHGGNHEATRLSAELGRPAKFITSPSGFTSRRTDAQTMDYFMMAYCGKVNKRLVEGFQASGVNAIGLSGIDGSIWKGSRKPAIRSVEQGRVRIIRDDFTGKVEAVNVELIQMLLGAGLLPVLSPPAISSEGQAINVDGDRAAGLTAAALQARSFIILTDTPGLLRKFPEESSLISNIPKDRIKEYQQYAKDRMKKKLLGAEEALELGLQQVVIADGRSHDPVSSALAGGGTHIQ
jgi:acetylglutamate/LysW-gamma-L-alpha-aminoadipate kinase